MHISHNYIKWRKNFGDGLLCVIARFKLASLYLFFVHSLQFEAREDDDKVFIRTEENLPQPCMGLTILG